MPVTKSAAKSMRRDRRRQTVNYRVREKIKRVVDVVRKGSDDASDLSKAFSVLDAASKKGVVHANKASRLKSRLNALVKSRTEKVSTKKSTTKKKPSTSSKKTSK
ncbi:30S ribosomal protein S20 [Patescibacteria group bacterium]